MLLLRGIDKSPDPTDMLQRINQKVRDDELPCLRGDNGAGKSTVIRQVSGANRHHHPQTRRQLSSCVDWPQFVVCREPTRKPGHWKPYDHKKAHEIVVPAVQNFGIGPMGC